MKTLVAFFLVAAFLLTNVHAQTSHPTDTYGGVLAIKGQSTGWFHVQQINDRDYLITPDGHAFFSLGVTHSIECTVRDELNLFETRYGGDESKLAEFFLRKFHQWGYNSSGYGPLPTMEQRIPYVATLPTIGPRSLSAGSKSKCHDLFDSSVLEQLRQRVRDHCQRHRNNKFCLGYVFIDLPIWSVKWQGRAHQDSYLDYLRSLPDSAPGKKAYLLEFPQQNHAENLEAAEDFINKIADRYYACVVDELRKHDPNHLILGDRLMALPERTPDSILVTAAKYVDVIAFQPMGTQVPLRQYIDHVHQITGKPVLLADVNTMLRRPGQQEPDLEEYQRSSGQHTLSYYLDAASSPHCVGLHRCTVRDYQPWNTNYHRRGLLKADDTEYPILVQFTRQANSQVYDLVYGKTETSAQPNAKDDEETLKDQPLAPLGMIDVTAPPFSADPTGKRDCTESLQRAIRFARDAKMVTYFPSGTYTINDTLECLHGRWDPIVGELRNTRDLPCILVGDRSQEKRPVIRLADNSPGFDDPQSPKHVVRFWAFGAGVEQAKSELQPNINMNQMMIGIDVAVGQRNPGAIAVRHRAAQGSSIQDCTIDARGGLIGLQGGAGSGGSHFGITVIGGKIGVDYLETQPAPTIAGFHLIDQTETAIVNQSRQALTIVGCKIETNTNGPLIVSRQSAAHSGQISMVDSSVEFKTGASQDAAFNTAISAAASLTLHNVFFRNADVIVQTNHQQLLTGESDSWVCVDEFAAAIAPPPVGNWTSMPGLQFGAAIYVDGEHLAEPVIASTRTVDGPPNNLTQVHLWDNQFPSWQTPGAVNVSLAPYHAKGNGATDDATAIQQAIDENEIVFLPKGVYAISKPLRLKPNTKLLGVGRCYSWIEPLASPSAEFSDPHNPKPLVQTADTADAETVLAFLGLRVNLNNPGAYCLDWQCGPKSIYRAVNVEMPGHWAARQMKRKPEYNFPLVKISGNGGGRFYNFHQESWSFHSPGYRHLLVEGTRHPLHLYQCNPEHARSDANMEIRDAKHVSVYGVKGEYQNPIIKITNSDQIRIFGYGGIAAAWPGKALFVVENTPNYLMTNLVDTPRFEGKGTPEHFAGVGVDPNKWHMLSDIGSDDGPPKMTRPLDRPAMVRRGKVEPTAASPGRSD